MSAENIQVDQTGSTATLTLIQPYGLSAEGLEEIHSAIEALAANEGLRALILTGGKPEAFLAKVPDLLPMTSAEALLFSKRGQHLCASIENLPFPVIAAIDGMALGGGCEMTLACDLVYASERSQFGQIEVHGGIIPGFGGTWRLPHRVGDLKARELLYTGAVLDAESAKAAGLIVEVVPHVELLTRARAMAQTISSAAPLAVRAAKALVLANRSLSIEASNTLERQMFASLFGTHDQREGMTSFLEKREAKFQGV